MVVKRVSKILMKFIYLLTWLDREAELLVFASGELKISGELKVRN